MISKKQVLIWMFTVLIIVLVSYMITERSKIEITLQESKYFQEEDLKLQITNNFGEVVCFSSCYPYFLERREEKWNSYQYTDCDKEDIIEKCIFPEEKRAFQLPLRNTERGIHRITIPICKNCKEGEVFKEEERIYSSEFEIN